MDGLSHPLILALAVVFCIAVVVLLLGWTLTILEMTAVYLLCDFTFNMGRVILRQRVPAPPKLADQDGHVELRGSRIRFCGTTRAIFSTRISRLPWTATHIPVKGVLTWRNSSADLLVRLPLGLSISGYAWIAACSSALVVLLLYLPTVQWREALQILPIAILLEAVGVAAGRLVLARSRKESVEFASEILGSLQRGTHP